jgi:hypothetical protein
MQDTRKAKVKSTGEVIEVYKLANGNYCDYSDCKTTYKVNELEFLNK